MEGIAGNAPKPAPQLVQACFGLVQSQLEPVVNVFVKMLQQLGLGVFDAVGYGFF